MTQKLRIFLACADKRLKLALLMLLDHQPGMDVAGISDQLLNLEAQINASHPDVLVIEWQENLKTIQDQLTNIRGFASPPQIVCMANNPRDKEAILAAGADYFIVKNVPPDELIEILKEIQSKKQGKWNQNQNYSIEASID
jgi:DNA-binding NarL/FixJ family response regulator